VSTCQAHSKVFAAKQNIFPKTWQKINKEWEIEKQLNNFSLAMVAISPHIHRSQVE